ncbi:MAG TPA: hypothetical protein VMC10_11630 [Stellaceae bacterium]|nr:hypothetical protein [Stellaceae bacterium]
MIGREEIAALIPHAGTMCLLDRVLEWDQTSIRCLSTRHRAEDNPMRRESGLGALCGIEFAAQAMAAHGRLAGGVGRKPQAGFLASLRDVRCSVGRLDHLEGDLIITAEHLMGDAQQVIYRFSLACGGTLLLSGRAAVVLDAGAP